MKNLITSSLIVLSFFGLQAANAEIHTCAAEKEKMNGASDIINESLAPHLAKMDEYKAQMKRETDELEEDVPERPNDAELTFNMKFDVDWKTEEIKLDLPQFTMNTQEWKFDVPQVTMKSQDWIFHTPSVRMVSKKIGETPHVTCDNAVIPSCTVKWKGNYTDIPEPFMEEQRIVLDVPEFQVDTTAIKLDIPETTWDTTSIKFDIPHFTLQNTTAELKKEGEELEERGKEISTKYSEKFRVLSALMQTTALDISSQIANEYSACLSKDILTKTNNFRTSAQQSMIKVSNLQKEHSSKGVNNTADQNLNTISSIESGIVNINAQTDSILNVIGDSAEQSAKATEAALLEE